jgi:hypothetical protein
MSRKVGSCDWEGLKSKGIGPHAAKDKNAANPSPYSSLSRYVCGSMRRKERIYHAIFTQARFVWIKSIRADPIWWR